MTPTGAATAIWTQVGESGRSIEAAMRAPGGEFGAPAPISSEGEEPLFPAIAVDADGNAVVSWSGSGEGGERARAVTRVGSGAFSAPAGISEAQGECCFHPDVAIDREGNATVVWNGFNGANKITRAAGYDADPPELRSLSVPATGTVGVPVTFSAQPFDVWPIVSTGFDFGDGTSAPGASVTHAYSSPGTFRVTATAADSAGSSTSASGTITIVPSNAFRLAKLKRNKKAGTATLIVDVPGPGRLTLSGKGVKRATASARRAGSVKLPVKPSRRTLKRLKARGKAKVKVTVTFSPDGGTPASQHRAIQLIERASGRRRGRRGPASGN